MGCCLDSLKEFEPFVALQRVAVKILQFFLRLLEIFETAFAASSRLIGSVVAALSLITTKYLVALLILSASMVVMLIVNIVMFNCRNRGLFANVEF